MTDLNTIETLVDKLIDELERLRDITPVWYTLAEFEADDPPGGMCWIVYKGRVTQAHYDPRGFFTHAYNTRPSYMSECITYVMPICAPAAPTGR